MTRFHNLRISDVRRETETSVSVAFEIDRHLKRAFAFKHGQFLTLRAMVDGREVRRCYSICSGTNEGELRIAIKRVEGGRFSTFALAQLKAGQTIDVMQPQGHFYLPLLPTAERTYVLCATGSGITPILSILKSVLAHEPGSNLLLFYGNRSRSDALFLDELKKLRAAFPARFSLFEFYSREEPNAGEFSGRVDDRILSLAQAALGTLERIDACFLCGAAGMVTDMRNAFAAAGVEDQKIFAELFDSPPDNSNIPAEVFRGAIATIFIDGRKVDIDLGTSTVLDAALEQGVELPYSCRTGSCSTCLAKVVEGRAHMMSNNSLEKWAVEKGYVLSCQTRSLTPTLTLEFGVEMVPD